MSNVFDGPGMIIDNGLGLVVNDGVCGLPDDHPGIAALALPIQRFHYLQHFVQSRKYFNSHALFTFSLMVIQDAQVPSGVDSLLVTKKWGL